MAEVKGQGAVVAMDKGEVVVELEEVQTVVAEAQVGLEEAQEPVLADRVADVVADLGPEEARLVAAVVAELGVGLELGAVVAELGGLELVVLRLELAAVVVELVVLGLELVAEEVDVKHAQQKLSLCLYVTRSHFGPGSHRSRHCAYRLVDADLRAQFCDAR